jgi:hypothetical protein
MAELLGKPEHVRSQYNRSLTIVDDCQSPR